MILAQLRPGSRMGVVMLSLGINRANAGCVFAIALSHCRAGEKSADGSGLFAVTPDMRDQIS